jgi:gluconate 2-dehydrogenase gamma chain
MNSNLVRRRRFLQAAAAAAAGAAVSCGRRSTPWWFLTLEEAVTISAVCDRIIPPDRDPGAASADVVVYIDRQLVGPLKKYQRAYRDGVLAIDLASHAQFGKRFAALAFPQQDRLLSSMEARRAPFFDLVRDHTMQGFYGDPRHGGNREYASWVMLDVPPAPIRGRQLYDLSGEGMARSTRRPRWRSNG